MGQIARSAHRGIAAVDRQVVGDALPAAQLHAREALLLFGQDVAGFVDVLLDVLGRVALEGGVLLLENIRIVASRASQAAVRRRRDIRETAFRVQRAADSRDHGRDPKSSGESERS